MDKTDEPKELVTPSTIGIDSVCRQLGGLIAMIDQILKTPSLNLNFGLRYRTLRGYFAKMKLELGRDGHLLVPEQLEEVRQNLDRFDLALTEILKSLS